MASQDMPAAKQPSDYCNSDLVSRLLAATPPYLYNMPLLPNSFFFSEMLRSFVQAKTAVSASTQPTPTTGNRRGRKRTWKDTKIQQHHLPPETNNNLLHEPDKPLELTTTGNRSPPPPPTKPPTPPPSIILPPEQIPPPPPIWYPYHPPSYPTAAPPFDPLHFFIDLRVSGHIWDQSKESGNNGTTAPVEPLNLQTDQKVSKTSTSFQQPEQMSSMFKPSRKHMSAFAVPKPREMSSNANGTTYDFDAGKPILGMDAAKSNSTTYGLDVAKPNKFTNNVDGNKTVSTNYVLQNLSKIYKDLESKSKKEEELNEFKGDQDEVLEVKEDVEEGKMLDKEKKTRDLRALIGLELVKDFVSIEGKKYPKGTIIPHANTNTEKNSGLNSQENCELKKETPDKVTDVDDDSNIQVDDDDYDDSDFYDNGNTNGRPVGSDDQNIDYSQRYQE